PGAGFVGSDAASPLAAAHTSCRAGVADGWTDSPRWGGTLCVVPDFSVTVFHDRPRSFHRSVARPVAAATTGETTDGRPTVRQPAADVFRAFTALSRRARRAGPDRGNGTPRLSVRSAQISVHTRGGRSDDPPGAAQRRPAAQHADRDGAQWTASDQASGTELCLAGCARHAGRGIRR